MPKRTLSAIRPSGEVLPLVLRRKHNKQLETPSAQTSATTNDDTKKEVPVPVFLHPEVDGEEINSVFTAEELENKMIQASQCMVELQKQLYRGEEVYVEDTHAHGNLFRGWDTFIDLRDIASPSSQPGVTRRVPADNRWFSGSCRSVARSSRPLSRASMTPTPTIQSTSASPVTAAMMVAAAAAPPIRTAPNTTPPRPPTVAATATQPTATPAAVIASKPPQATPPKKLGITVPDRSPEPAADAPETPLRRNSARKRKQGES